VTEIADNQPVDFDVIVVGAGPTGMLLAAELSLQKISVLVVDSLPKPSETSRASTLFARAMEILSTVGVLDKMEALKRKQHGHFAGITVDLTSGSEFDGSWNLPQAAITATLYQRNLELGTTFAFGSEVIEVTQSAKSVVTTLDGSQGVSTIKTRFLVGCDGATSDIAGFGAFEFHGYSGTARILRADVEGIDIPDRSFQRTSRGLSVASRQASGETRVMTHEYSTAAFEDAPDSSLVATWQRVTGEDLSAGAIVREERLDATCRVAKNFRDGRLILAGDAAHPLLPIGGQPLNLGIQDAFNLGWKLAQVVKGRSFGSILDTYSTERGGAAQEALIDTMAQYKIIFGDASFDYLRASIGGLLEYENVQTHFAKRISGLGHRYPVGTDSHPLIGCRISPDDLVIVPDGTLQSIQKTRSGILIVDVSEGSHSNDINGLVDSWQGQVIRVKARIRARARHPEAGAILLRPDGYIAWAGTQPYEGLAEALTDWFGPAQTKAHN